MITLEFETISIFSLYQVLFHKILIKIVTTRVLTPILHKIFLPFLKKNAFNWNFEKIYLKNN